MTTRSPEALTAASSLRSGLVRSVTAVVAGADLLIGYHDDGSGVMPAPALGHRSDETVGVFRKWAVL